MEIQSERAVVNIALPCAISGSFISFTFLSHFPLFLALCIFPLYLFFSLYCLSLSHSSLRFNSFFLIYAIFSSGSSVSLFSLTHFFFLLSISAFSSLSLFSMSSITSLPLFLTLFASLSLSLLLSLPCCHIDLLLKRVCRIRSYQISQEDEKSPLAFSIFE